MSTDADVAKQSKDSTEPSTEYVVHEHQLGIWKYYLAQTRSQGFWAETKETCFLLKKLVKDIHEASPKLLYLLVLVKAWNGIENVVEMRLLNLLLSQVEQAVSGRGDINAVLFAIGGKILHSITDAYVRWIEEFIMPTMNQRLERHFQLQILKIDLGKDLTSSTQTSEPLVTHTQALKSLKKVLGLVQGLFQVSSQLWLLKRVARLRGGKVVFGIFFLQTILARLSSTLIWRKPMFAYISNEAYKRTQALINFTDGSFRQDIISSDLGSWVLDEYKKAFSALGTTSTEHLFDLAYRSSPVMEAMQDILRNFPSIYFAIVAIKNPHHMSIASIATLQNLGRRLFYSSKTVLYQLEGFRENLNSLKSLYKIPKVVKDGTSCSAEKVDGSSKGMSMSLKNVFFAYPTGGKATDALKGITLDIDPGQLVVVVGANGSGKSTLTRILARLYDPSSGEFLVDGQPSTSYRFADHHRTTALLSQDSQVFPLTLAENIALGYPEHSSDLEMIKEAASEGGAAEFIEELEEGYETMLESFDRPFHLNLHGNKEHPLFVMSEKLTKKSDVSGGQRQRIIAARTFMRFKSGKITSVIVDEPSSALDADAELQLFQRLISAREGKTMVFVTHRFGHLTKVADLIICMKDGKIIESGNHEDLMTAAGEYAKLYKIQAQAFSEEKVADPSADGADPPASDSAGI